MTKQLKTLSTESAPAIHTSNSQEERDKKLVKGRFRCFEPQGGSVTLSYRRYKSEPIKRYTFMDGQEYEIPLGLARHLRENCCYYKHSHIMDSQGNFLVDQKNNRVDRMTFEPMGFGLDGGF